MINLYDIMNIEEVQEPIFKDDDSMIIRKTILYKADDNTGFLTSLNINTNRYGVFINRDSCILLNGEPFNSTQYFHFENEELWLLDRFSEDYFNFNKYYIEGKQGYYYNIKDNYFWIDDDDLPE